MSDTSLATAVLEALAFELPDLTTFDPPKALQGSRNGGSQVFRIQTPNQTFALKLSADFGPNPKLPRLAPACLAERSIAELLDAALARKAFALARRLDAGARWVRLMEWVPGTRLETLDDETLGKLIDCITQIHAAPAPKSLHDFALPSSIHALAGLSMSYADELRNKRVLDSADTHKIRKCIKRALQKAENLRIPVRERLCHGDLRLDNFIDDGTHVRAIDFDHAGRGDPAVDFAAFVCRTPLSAYDELRLLTKYDERTKDDSFLDRYFQRKPLVALAATLGAALDHVDVLEGRRNLLAVARADETLLRQQLHDALGSEQVVFRWRSKSICPPNTWVAVDGTAASLKTPFCARLSRLTGLPHFNTGKLYRYVALVAWESGLDVDRANDDGWLAQRIEAQAPSLQPDGSLHVQGSRLDQLLETRGVEATVASWASKPRIRETVTKRVRASLAAASGGIVEGRDIGSVILPDAPIKLFVDAPIEDRARAFSARTGRNARDARAQLSTRDTLDRRSAVAGAIRVSLSDGQALERQASTWAKRLEEVPT